MSFLEESLKDIAKLYCPSGKEADLPFFKAIQCNQAEGKLDGLNKWEEISGKKNIFCEEHKPEKQHRCDTLPMLSFWSFNKVTSIKKFKLNKWAILYLNYNDKF